MSQRLHQVLKLAQNHYYRINKEQEEFPLVIPVLDSLSPNTIASEDPDFTLSCMGFNFNNETIIQFGQYDEPTTLISETEVTTIVKPSLFAPAVVPIRVHNKELYSTSVNFTFTSAQEGFGAQRR